MFAPDFWGDSPEAVELTIEGNRLIAREVLDLCQHLWRSYGKRLTGRFARQLGIMRDNGMQAR